MHLNITYLESHILTQQLHYSSPLATKEENIFKTHDTKFKNTYYKILYRQKWAEIF